MISAAPQEIVQSALEGIVPPDHIFGTRFRYNEATGEVDSIIRAAAGWGKISVLEKLRANLGISHGHIIYLGDGASADRPIAVFARLKVTAGEPSCTAERDDDFSLSPCAATVESCGRDQAF